MLTQRLEERGRFVELDPVGIIDIGSNSIRLVVYEGAVRASTPLFNEKELCGLGRPVAASGRIGEQASKRAYRALRRFRALADRLDVTVVKAIATAAVRDAADGSTFIAACEKICGTPIDVLTGEEEACLAAQGIMMGFVDPAGFVGDLGGGSLELIEIGKEAMNEATTLPLGGLRLLENSGGKIDKAIAIADKQLAGVGWLAKGKKRPFYAVGGTWRSFAKLHMAQVDYPLRVMQGYSLKPAAALSLAAKLQKPDELAKLRGIGEVSKARREVLPFGAVVLERLLKVLQPSEIIVSVHGVREGVLFGLLPDSERRKDPLISFCQDYARLRSRSFVHAQELCAWTDVLFEPPNGMPESAQERRLRHAACLISDIGWRAHPDYRGEQSLNVVAHSALAGIDHPGRLFLAMSIYYRHAGQGADAGQHLSPRLKAAVPRSLQMRARIIGAAVRAAHMLSAGMAGIVPFTPLSLEGNTLAIDIPERFADIDGERLRRRFQTLAKLLDRKLVVRIV